MPARRSSRRQSAVLRKTRSGPRRKTRSGPRRKTRSGPRRYRSADKPKIVLDADIEIAKIHPGSLFELPRVEEDKQYLFYLFMKQDNNLIVEFYSEMRKKWVHFGVGRISLESRKGTEEEVIQENIPIICIEPSGFNPWKVKKQRLLLNEKFETYLEKIMQDTKLNVEFSFTVNDLNNNRKGVNRGEEAENDRSRAQKGQDAGDIVIATKAIGGTVSGISSLF